MQVFNGKATVNQLAQNWGISYFGNMIGTLIIITLMSLGGVFPYQASGVLKMALPKVGLTFTQVIPFDEKFTTRLPNSGCEPDSTRLGGLFPDLPAFV